jgi:signal transduction histidine kinase
LQPINELALRADELNRMTFDEDKYQRIEDAITHIQPEETEMLSLGDSDLQGIEAAMNNLLRRMRDSYRQQSRFVNDASHELRTPIAVIGGYANMLARWGKTDEKVLDESIAAIQHESEHMGYLVEQLLFLARGDSGKTVLARERFDAGGMMREIYEESVMVDERHSYRFADSGQELYVEADPALLKQAVRILVDNAAKYTRDGDEILLGYGKTEENLPFLLVQDTGIGMAEADVAHMFERFYRADDARGQEGTGLGLSIAKWIVDKHGGHFEVLSRTELGTRIRIVLKKKQ